MHFISTTLPGVLALFPAPIVVGDLGCLELMAIWLALSFQDARFRGVVDVRVLGLGLAEVSPNLN